MLGGLTETPKPDQAEEPEAASDARAMGATDEQIAVVAASLQRQTKVPGFEGVWHQNAEIVQAFLSVTTQWRTVNVLNELGSHIRFTGFDYAGVRVSLEALDIRITPGIWSGLQVMETAACNALNRIPQAG